MGWSARETDEPELKALRTAAAHDGESGTTRRHKRLVDGRRRCPGVSAQQSYVGAFPVPINLAVGVAAPAAKAARGGVFPAAVTPLPAVAAAAAVQTEQPRTWRQQPAAREAESAASAVAAAPSERCPSRPTPAGGTEKVAAAGGAFFILGAQTQRTTKGQRFLFDSVVFDQNIGPRSQKMSLIDLP